MAKSTFGREFAKARKAQGAGGAFVWLKSEGGDGESYSTNIAGETGKKSSKGFSVEMAKKAIDKAVGPKPMRRPAMATSKDAPMQTSPRPPRKPTELMPVAKSVKVAKAGDITVSKLAPVAKIKVAGRGGYASGAAAGMPGKKSETPAEREKRISDATPLGRLINSFKGPYTRVPEKPKVGTSTPTLSRKAAIEAAMKKRNK